MQTSINIRTLPLTLVRREIKNVYIRSFLYYVPYVTLAVMTFPAILYSTNAVISGAVALAVALIAALCKRSLVTVAALSCAAVFITELIIRIL